MRVLQHLFENNRTWAARMRERDPGFFETLAAQQTPQYLWIGCSDSRVPANEIIGLLPGEVFVHRNIANAVIHTDLNCLSVLQYGVDVLEVRHIIVCGHYGCGGLSAAMQNREFGLIDNWLRHLKDVYQQHEAALTGIEDEEERFRRYCELNVIEQVHHVCQTSIVQRAWGRGQSLAVHGWVYDIHDGLLRDIQLCITSPEEINSFYRLALDA